MRERAAGGAASWVGQLERPAIEAEAEDDLAWGNVVSPQKSRSLFDFCQVGVSLDDAAYRVGRIP